MQSFEELFQEEIQDIYSAETQIIEALPNMIEAALHPKLKEGFEKHLIETQTHVERIEEIAEDLDIPLEGKLCMGMEGLLKETQEIIDEHEASAVKDAALIG